MLATTLVLSIGKGLFLATVMVYLLRVVKLGTVTATATWSLWGAASVMVSFPVGLLLDRSRSRAVGVAAACGAALVVPVAAHVHALWALMLVLCLGGGFDSMANVARRALVASGTSDTVAALAWARTVSNIGFALGGLLAVWLLSDMSHVAYSIAYGGVGVTYLVLAFFFAVTSLSPRRAPDPATGGAMPRKLPHSPRTALTLAASTGILCMHATLLTTIMPLWITKFTRVPVWTLGWLVMLNALLVIVAQIPVSRRASTASGAARSFTNAALSIAACCVLLGAARFGPVGWQAAALLAATIAVTFGELFQAAGEWGLSALLAGDREHGFYQAACVFGESAQSSIGPFALGSLVTALPVVGWAVLIAVVGLGRWITSFLSVPSG